MADPRQKSSLTLAQIDAALKGVALESLDHPGCYYRMVDGVQEWVNPPMVVGSEYRTTERFLGNPVYTKAIALGKLPNNTTKTVFDNTVGHVAAIVDFSAELYVSTLTAILPYDSTKAYIQAVNGRASGLEIIMKTAADYSGYDGRVRVKYTKKTS